MLVKRFACNAAIDTSKAPFDNIKQLVSESRAFLTQTAGQWRYVIQNDATSNHTVSYDDIVDEITRSPNGARDKYNRVTITYVDPDKEWETNEATYPLDDAEYQSYLEEDNWEESNADITVESCTNRYQALDIARQALLESRIGGTITFNGQPWMIKVRCGDLLVMDVPGLKDGVLWRVATRTVSADGSISFACAAYDPTIFPWIDIPDQDTIVAPTIADASSLPAPETLAYISNEWNDATVGSLTWSQSNSAFVHDYLIEIYRKVDSIQVLSTTLASSNDWPDDYMPSLSLPYLAAGEYYATVRARNALTRSSATTATFSISVPAVGRVSGLSITGDFDRSLTVVWDALNDISLKHYQVEIYDSLNGVSLSVISVAKEIVTIEFELFKSIGLPRAFEVRVRGVNTAGDIGETSAIAVSKPAPVAPAVQLWGSVNDIKLTLSAAANATGSVIWLSDADPVEKTTENQRYKGESLAVTLDGLAPITDYYIAIASYDSFGLGTASAHSATTLNDSVSDSIQQLTERDLSIGQSIEEIKSDLALKSASIDDISEDLSIKAVEIQQISADLTSQSTSAYSELISTQEQVMLSAALATEARRKQQAQNDEYYHILNAVVEIDPTTGTITNRAYEYTDSKFSQAILLIDGVNSSITAQTSRIETTESSLLDTQSVLAIQSGLINQRATYTELTETVANAITAIQPAYSTNFNTGLDGWSAQSGTAIYNVGAWIDATLGDIVSDMNYVGADNPVVQLTIARDSGAVWIGKIQYRTAEHGYSSSHEMSIPEVSDDGQQYTVSVDFGDVTDYNAETITGLRMILGATVSDGYQLHSVQAGKRTAAQAAIEGLQGRVSTAEQNINAVTGQLSNYVTTAFYEQNSLTQNDVQQTLDSWNAQYSIVAKLTQFDENGTIEKANSAEQWIDGAQALITQIAQTTTQNEYSDRINTVEQTLDAQSGSIAQQIISTHKLQVADDDISANAFLTAAKAAESSRDQVAQKDSIATARSETKAVADDLQAESGRVDEFVAKYDENDASIKQTLNTLSNVDQTIAESVETLQSAYDENKSAVQQSLNTLANADETIAESVETLQSAYDENKSAVQQSLNTLANADETIAESVETLQSAYDENKSAVQQSLNTLANADQTIAESVETLQSAYDENKSAVQQSLSTLANADETISESVETLQSDYGENKSAVQQTLNALANADETIAESVETFQSAYNENKSAVQQSLNTLTSKDTALARSIENLSSTVGDNKAEVDEYKRTAIGYCVDTDGNPTSHETAEACELSGNTWMGEASIAEAIRNTKVTATDSNGNEIEISAGSLYQTIVNNKGEATAQAAILAIFGDQLAGIFANVGEDGSALEFIANSMKFKTENGTKTPFSVEGDNVYLDQASIKSLNVEKLKSSDGSLVFDNGKLKADFIDVDDLRIGETQIKDGSITNAKIKGDLKSNDFAPGLKGWRIRENGTAEFNGVVITREMVVASGTVNLGNINCGNSSGINKVYETIIDTGVASNAWSGTKYYTTTDSGIQGGSPVNANVNTLSQAAWGVTSEVISLTRWTAAYGGPTIHLRIKVYARRVNSINPLKVNWRLLKVS